MLGIRTRGHRMVGTDETTELWRPPGYNCLHLDQKVGGGRDRNILNKERKEKNHLLIIIDDKREMQHIDTDR